MNAVEKVIQTAVNEIGYIEKASNSQLDSRVDNAGSANFTKFARDLDSISYFNGPKNGYPWCAVFFNWLLVQNFGKDLALQMTGQPKSNNNAASCTGAVNYYKQINSFYKEGPRPGDQIFFSNNGGQTFNHTGLVTRVDNTKVYTIEGNTSSELGVIDNGGCVRQKSYPLSYNKIGGYGRPRYELVEEEEEMTQDTFNEMMKNYLNNLSNQPASFEQDALVWAQQNGLLQGDQTGNLMPKKFLTRGEFAVVLKRFWEKFISKK